MAVREVFVGGEMDCWTMVQGDPGVSTNSYDYDPSFSQSAVNIFFDRAYRGNFKDEAGAGTSIPVGERCHVMFHITRNVFSAGDIFRIFDVNGRPCYRFTFRNETWARLEHNTATSGGTTWTLICETQAFSPDGRTYFAFNVGTSGSTTGEIYTNGSFAVSGTYTPSGANAALSYIVLGPTPNQSCFFSQVMVTENKPVVGARVWTRKPSANGAVQDMAGGYANLVKTSIDDTTAVVSSATGQAATYDYQDVTTPVGMVFGEVWQWSRARHDGTSPTNLKSVCRIGSTNYTTPNMSGLVVGFAPIAGRWQVNPATSARWTDATFNSAQLGMESAA